MNLDLSSLALPIRLTPETPLSDEQLIRFSRLNRPFRMEREPNGEILIMTPACTKALRSLIFEEQERWETGPMKMGAGRCASPTQVSRCRMAPFARLMRRG